MVVTKWGNEWESSVRPVKWGAEHSVSLENRETRKETPRQWKWANTWCGVSRHLHAHPQDITSTSQHVTSLVYFSKDIVSQPLELLCTPTYGLFLWLTMPPLCGSGAVPRHTPCIHCSVSWARFGLQTGEPADFTPEHCPIQMQPCNDNSWHWPFYFCYNDTVVK